MNITILAIGTRGDVQPAVALGKALQNSGHLVCVVASSDFAGWITAHGLAYFPVGYNTREQMEHDDRMMRVGHQPVRLAHYFRQWHKEQAAQLGEAIWQASDSADLIISSIISNDYALAVAEKRGIHCAHLALQPPQLPSADGRVMLVGLLKKRAHWLNRWFSSRFNQHVPWYMSGAAVNQLRQRLGLARNTFASSARKRREQLTINAYSSQLAPHPDDWQDKVQTVGFFYLDDHPDWQPPADLLAFLNAGEPPVYIGFGSMIDPDPAALTRLLLEIARHSSRRFILSAGWAELGGKTLPNNVFKIGRTPHGWLFPRMAAVVHHGGAGSTAASTRAGVPTQIVHYIADQPYWGRRVCAIGIGPKPIARKRLTASRLAAGIEQMLTDQTMRARAAELGGLVSAENGTAKTVTLIENTFT